VLIKKRHHENSIGVNKKIGKSFCVIFKNNYYRYKISLAMHSLLVLQNNIGGMFFTKGKKFPGTHHDMSVCLT